MSRMHTCKTGFFVRTSHPIKLPSSFATSNNWLGSSSTPDGTISMRQFNFTRRYKYGLLQPSWALGQF